MPKKIKRIGGIMFLAGFAGFVLFKLTFIDHQLSVNFFSQTLLVATLWSGFLGLFLFVLGSVLE